MLLYHMEIMIDPQIIFSQDAEWTSLPETVYVLIQKYRKSGGGGLKAYSVL